MAQDITLIRRQLDLVEHVLSDGELVVTLPGRTGPPDNLPAPQRPRRRRRGPSPATIERHRLSVERATRAYELARTGSTWAFISKELGYASALSAHIAVRRLALRSGLPWPVRRGAR